MKSSPLLTSLYMTDLTDLPLIRVAFESFFHGWLVRHERPHEQLRRSLDMEETRISLIQQVVSHYQQNYEENLKLASEDIFLVFSAPWLSLFEQSLQWIGGLKPSMVPRIIQSSVRDLSAGQCLRMERVKAESRWKERELSEAMARMQESIGTPTFMALALQTEMDTLRDEETTAFQSPMEELKVAMVAVFEKAEVLRRWVIRKPVKILRTSQQFKFLAAIVEFQLRSSRWGLHRASRTL